MDDIENLQIYLFALNTVNDASVEISFPVNEINFVSLGFSQDCGDIFVHGPSDNGHAVFHLQFVNEYPSDFQCYSSGIL